MPEAEGKNSKGFVWTEERIRLMQDAAEYAPWYEALAITAAKYLPINASLCDAGCGLGYLSLALVAHCASVTAADISKEALDVLRTNITKRNIPNIRVYEGDVLDLPENERFDGMVFCFFGTTEQILKTARAHCDDTVVMIKKAWRNHRFTVEKIPPRTFTYEQTCSELDAPGIPYRTETVTLDMGQPFRSLADARTFFQTYNRSENPAPLTDAELAARLVATGDTTFPYYLKAEGTVGFIAVRVSDIPQSAC